MTAILTNSFRLKQAELFLEAFENSAEKNIYLGIGRPNSWENELIPDVPIDNITTIGDCFASLIGLKKLSVNDVINVVPRFNWQTNTVYIAYSNLDENLFLHPTSEEIAENNLSGYGSGSFYVITDDYNVYKCLKSNGPSTIKPDLKTLTPFETADGYKWKYLYTVNPSVIEKFLSDSWLPVVFLTADDDSDQWQVQENAVSGSIDNIDILNAGSTYNKLFNGTVVTANSTTVQFDSVVGSTDLTGETVLIATGLGAGQFRKINSYDIGTKTATVTSWTAPNATSTYKIIPTIELDGDGSGFAGYIVIDDDEIIDIVITNSGSNYTFANITLSSGTGYVLNGAISPLSGHGGNPVQELGGSFLMISSLLEYDPESSIITDNDYRRILLLTNVLDNSDEIAAATTATALRSIEIENISGGPFERNEIVELSNGAKIYIVSIDEANNKLFYIQNFLTGIATFTDSETLTGETSGATADIADLIDADIKPNSGEIIYIKNLRPVLRSPSLIEDIKILVKF